MSHPNVRQRNNVHESGSGAATIVFVHGFGCDQNMWRQLMPSYAGRYKTVSLDLVGAGMSDLSAFDTRKYADLQGHADDMLEVIQAVAEGPAIFVGHSVSAMIGMLADLKQPGLIAAHAMIAPSPSYINQGDYHGGFERADIDSLLQTLEGNYLGWSSNMAPAIMGAAEQPQLAEELTNSFCRTDPDIAKHFARVTFLSDHRALLPRLATPTLILQCDDDIIAPVSVGEYMRRVMPDATLAIIENVGHCPHMSRPSECSLAIDRFLRAKGL